MKDELSIFTDTEIPKPDKFSKTGLIFFSIYLLASIYALIRDCLYILNDWGDEVITSYLALPWTLTWGVLFMALDGSLKTLSIVTHNGDDWRYMAFFILLVLISITMNAFLLYFIGEKIEQFIRKLLSCLPSTLKQ